MPAMIIVYLRTMVLENGKSNTDAYIFRTGCPLGCCQTFGQTFWDLMKDLNSPVYTALNFLYIFVMLFKCFIL